MTIKMKQETTKSHRNLCHHLRQRFGKIQEDIRNARLIKTQTIKIRNNPKH